MEVCVDPLPIVDIWDKYHGDKFSHNQPFYSQVIEKAWSHCNALNFAPVKSNTDVKQLKYIIIKVMVR